MIKQSDIITVSVTTGDLVRVEANSVSAELGRLSQCRDTEDRQANRETDQDVGQRLLEN